MEENSNVWKPTALLIGSGGARGYMFLGATHRLFCEGYLENVTKYTGVSIGAVICLLLAVGYTPREIWKEAKYLKSTDLVKVSSNVFKNLGLFTTDIIRGRLNNLIKQRYDTPLTFKDLYEKTGNELSVLAFDFVLKRGVVFSLENTPDVDVLDGICGSISLPMMFEPFQDRYIDGAMHDPYPIYLLDKEGDRVLGLYIDDKVSEDAVSRINAIITGNLDGKRNENIERSSDRCQHIRIHSSYLDTSGISLDTDKKMTLMAGGDTSAFLWIRDVLTRNEAQRRVNQKLTFMKSVLNYNEMLMEEGDVLEENERLEVVPHSKNYDNDFLN